MKAFTLLESLVVIGMLMATSFFILPSTLSRLSDARADEEAKGIASNIFVTQQNAYSAKNDSAYGIKLYNNRYVFYMGNSFETATQTETFYVKNGNSISNISLSGGSTDINFPKDSFRPSASGSISVSSSTETTTILINSEGLIDVVGE